MAVSGVISIVLYLVIDLILACGTIDTGEPLGWMVVAIAVIYTVFAVLLYTYGASLNEKAGQY